MAKFSQQFLRAMTQPSYQEGLFTAAKELGGLRGRLKEEERLRAEQIAEEQRKRGVTGGLLGLQQAIARGEDPSEAIGSLVNLGATAEQVGQAQQTGMQRREKFLAEQQRQREEQVRQNLVTAAQTKATSMGKEQPFKDALATASAEELRKYIITDVEPTTYQLSAGAALVDAQGKVLYRNPFKPTAPRTPSIKTEKTDDEIIVLTDGVETNRIKINQGESEAAENARLDVAYKTGQLMQTITDAKEAVLTRFGTGDLAGGITASLLPGSPAYEITNAYYNTIRGQEAFREIDELRKSAREYGSTGTGLGQITQIEFGALQGNLAGLSSGLSDELQIKQLTKIENNLKVLSQLAQGESIVDVVDWNSETYTNLGYLKDGDDLFFYPQGPSGKELKYNRATDKFEEQ